MKGNAEHIDTIQALSQPAFIAIVNSSEDAIIVLDPKRTIRFANAAAIAFGSRSGKLNILGASYDELLAQSTIRDERGDILAFDSYPSRIAMREKRIVTGVKVQQVLDSAYRWLKVAAIPMLDERGEIEYTIVRLTDVSEQKAVEDKLHFLIQTSKVLSLTSDMEERFAQKSRLTVPLLADWCVVHMVREDGSLTRTALVHRDHEKERLVLDLLEKSDNSMHASSIVRRVIETGIPVFYPDIVHTSAESAPDASDWLALSRALGVTSSMILPITSRGVVLGVLSLAYSDSRRRYTDEDFKFMQEYCNHISLLLENAHLYEEIQTRDASKDAFLAALSHELRNPLAPIKSMLELMKLQPHASEYRHNISVIEHQFDHLTKILSDLLEVNRYSRGKIHAELRRVNLLTVVRNSSESAGPFLKKKNLQFVVDIPSHAIVIRADQTRLEQALMNLLHNAEKFTPEGGKIWIRVAADATTATITIGDTGAGIEAEMLEHMFDPWIRDEKVPHITEGLGLGLMLVKEIVELHGGTIEAKSEGKGKGSEFTITLPVLQQRLL